MPPGSAHGGFPSRVRHSVVPVHGHQPHVSLKDTAAPGFLRAKWRSLFWGCYFHPGSWSGCPECRRKLQGEAKRQTTKTSGRCIKSSPKQVETKADVESVLIPGSQCVFLYHTRVHVHVDTTPSPEIQLSLTSRLKVVASLRETLRTRSRHLHTPGLGAQLGTRKLKGTSSLAF